MVVGNLSSLAKYAANGMIEGFFVMKSAKKRLTH